MDMSPTTRERKAFEWNDKVKAYLNSGLSASDFCRQHELNLQSFLTWLGRHHDNRRDILPIKVSADAGARATLSSSNPVCELITSRGHRLRFDGSALTTDLSALIIKLAY